MKILVIDNTGQISANLFAQDTDVAFYCDEILGFNAAEQQPELILLNYALRSEKTPDYIRLLTAAAPTASLIVIGENTHEDDIFRCLLAGAKGHQESQSLPHYLVKLIKVVSQGEAWISRSMVTKLLDTIRELDGK